MKTFPFKHELTIIILYSLLLLPKYLSKMRIRGRPEVAHPLLVISPEQTKNMSCIH